MTDDPATPKGDNPPGPHGDLSRFIWMPGDLVRVDKDGNEIPAKDKAEDKSGDLVIEVAGA